MQRIHTVVKVKDVVIILPKIGNERVVPKALFGMDDPHNNINNPGKWVTWNVF
jgi:hypothetical protein